MVAIGLATTLCVILIGYAAWLCIVQIDKAPECESELGKLAEEPRSDEPR